MIPTAHDYYRRRAREHRHLAGAAQAPEQREMHDRLVGVYQSLAREARLRQPLVLKD